MEQQKKQQNDYKEDTSAQEYRGRWQNIAQSKWTTIGIVLILIVVTMLRTTGSNTSAVSFATDLNDVGIVTPNVSVVFSIDEVDAYYRTSQAEWEQGELIFEHAQTDNTVEAEYKNAMGEYLMMAYPASPDLIVICYGEKMVVFNAQNAEDTDQWFRQLTAAVEK